jgi:hypothetical protein
MFKFNIAESKTKAAAFAALLVSLVATSFLGTTATDYVNALPDVLEAPAYSLIAAALVYVAGFRKANTGALAPSTIDAAERYLRSKGYIVTR